jgi:hypothetical protein
MAATSKKIDQMRREPTNVRFGDLKKVCEEKFGKPRQLGTSHAISKTPWIGDPRINIQDDKGKAKAYQVRQVYPENASLATYFGSTQAIK